MRRLLPLLLVLLLCAGCVFGQAMFSEDRGETHYGGVCERYTGPQSCVLTLGENACINLRCTVERKSGELDINVGCGAENYEYAGLQENVELVLQLTEPGDYTLSVDADNFSGSFRFEWETVGAAP